MEHPRRGYDSAFDAGNPVGGEVGQQRVGDGNPLADLMQDPSLEEASACVTPGRLGQPEVRERTLAEEWRFVRRQRSEHRPLGAVQGVPSGLKRIARFVTGRIKRLPELFGTGRLARRGPFPEVVGEHHRPLGVTTRDVEDRLEGAARVPTGHLEPPVHVIRKFGIG